MSRTTAIVLAAGASLRLGEPKALVEAGSGETVLGSVLRRLRAAAVPEIVVVTRHELVSTLAAVAAAYPPVAVLSNPRPEDGRVGTVQVGLRHLADLRLDGDAGGPPPGLPGRVLIVPVDRPGWSSATLARLLAESTTTCPSADGRGGHPLLLCGTDVERVASAAPDAPLSGLFTAHYLEVDDPHLHLNVDTPADLDEVRVWAAWVADTDDAA